MKHRARYKPRDVAPRACRWLWEPPAYLTTNRTTAGQERKLAVWSRSLSRTGTIPTAKGANPNDSDQANRERHARPSPIRPGPIPRSGPSAKQAAVVRQAIANPDREAVPSLRYGLARRGECGLPGIAVRRGATFF